MSRNPVVSQHGRDRDPATTQGPAHRMQCQSPGSPTGRWAWTAVSPPRRNDCALQGPKLQALSSKGRAGLLDTRRTQPAPHHMTHMTVRE